MAAPPPLASSAAAPRPPAATTPSETAPDPLAKLPSAKPISFKSVVQKAVVELAEPFWVTIEVRHPKRDVYALPRHFDWKDFHVRQVKSALTGKDPQTSLFRLELQAFVLGDVSIPALYLPVHTPVGEEQLQIPPQEIKVTGVIDPSQGKPQLRPDDRPLPRAYTGRYWPLYVLFVLAGAGALALWWQKRSRRPVPPPPPAPRAPADEEALARLAQLEAEGLVARGEKQIYFFRLTEILRDYFGRRYTFDALEMTTEELLAELKRRSTPGLDFDQTATFCAASDLVKFARREASDGECKTGLDTARALIERTRPAPALPGGGA